MPFTQYEFTQKLSNTIQGVVYKAIDLKHQTPVAVKVASKARLKSPTSYNHEDIHNEATLMKRLQPGQDAVVRYLDKIEDAKNVYLVMEYAENGDLFNHLSNCGNFDEITAKSYFKDLVKAVKTLHNAQICHLDISLENVVLCAGGKLKLCDLGVAKSVTVDSKLCTRNGIFRPGKLKYMSPECSALNSFDPYKADVYALGVVLFCLLFGFHPYDAEAVLRFRDFQANSMSQESQVLQSTDYAEFLQRSQLPITHSDLIYTGIVSDDPEFMFEMYQLQDQVSSQAKDLICSMMFTEDYRISLDEILNHPWLSQ